MSTAPLLLALVPSVLLLGVVGGYWPAGRRFWAVWVGFGLGMAVAAPVWAVESVIDNYGATLASPYLKILVQEVPGGAMAEELFIFLAFAVNYLLFRRLAERTLDVVVLAVAPAIGFTTVENLLAVFSAGDPMAMAVDRLMSIVAGHAVLQLVMGYFAAKALFSKNRRGLYALLMLAIPILVHGWGDYTEGLFQYKDGVSPHAETSRLLMSAWILGLFAYFAAAVAVLWQLKVERPACDLDVVEVSADESH